MTTTSELRSKLESKGEEVSQIAHQIEDRLENLSDWPGIVRLHPMQAVGAAAIVGLLLSGSRGGFLRLLSRQLEGIVKTSATAFVVSAVNQKMNASPQV